MPGSSTQNCPTYTLRESLASNGVYYPPSIALPRRRGAGRVQDHLHARALGRARRRGVLERALQPQDVHAHRVQGLLH